MPPDLIQLLAGFGVLSAVVYAVQGIRALFDRAAIRSEQKAALDADAEAAHERVAELASELADLRDQLVRRALPAPADAPEGRRGDA